MNILRIFLESSIAAQIIMTILVIFSVWSWGIFLKKIFDFAKVQRKSSAFFSNFRFRTGVKDLENLGEQLHDNPYGRILGSGLEEFKKLSLTKQMFSGKQNYQKGSNEWMTELSDNIRLAMESAKITETRDLESALPTLSTFVSVSPFLGLLGTVWGIMVAFLEIRARGSAHITIVAPGISDALITTVYGLLVAIPALIFHNIFRSRINRFDSEMDKFMSEVFARLRKELTLT